MNQQSLFRVPSGLFFWAGSCANNYVSFGNVIIAGDSGIINEIRLFGFWYWLAGVQDAFMLCRDVLGQALVMLLEPRLLAPPHCGSKIG